MEQLRPGVIRKATDVPSRPHAERPTDLLEAVAERGAEPAAARSAGEVGTPAQLHMRVAVRQTVPEAERKHRDSEHPW